jgi:hypothetical protein
VLWYLDGDIDIVVVVIMIVVVDNDNGRWVHVWSIIVMKE